MKIEIRGVTKQFGSLGVLKNISLDILPGQIVALLGANGAGKTTLLRCLAGILSPQKGDILYDGQVFRRDRIDLRRRFFFLSDMPFMFSNESVLGHIAMVLKLYESDHPGVEDRVLQILKNFEMLTLAEMPAAHLSRGQRYKAALAALMAVDPEVLLLDEPFASGMDPQGILSLKDHCREALNRGRTILYTTQILDIAERFSDRVCILHKGEVHAFDSIPKLRESLATDGGVLEEIFRRLRGEGS